MVAGGADGDLDQDRDLGGQPELQVHQAAAHPQGPQDLAAEPVDPPPGGLGHVGGGAVGDLDEVRRPGGLLGGEVREPHPALVDQGLPAVLGALDGPLHQQPALARAARRRLVERRGAGHQLHAHAARQRQRLHHDRQPVQRPLARRGQAVGHQVLGLGDAGGGEAAPLQGLVARQHARSQRRARQAQLVLHQGGRGDLRLAERDHAVRALRGDRRPRRLGPQLVGVTPADRQVVDQVGDRPGLGGGLDGDHAGPQPAAGRQVGQPHPPDPDQQQRLHHFYPQVPLRDNVTGALPRARR